MFESHGFFVGESLIVFDHRAQERGDIVHHTDIPVLESPLVFFSEYEVPSERLTRLQWEYIERVVFMRPEQLSAAHGFSGLSIPWNSTSYFLIDGPDRRESGVILVYEEPRHGWVLLYGEDIVDMDRLGYMVDDILESLLSELGELVDFRVHLVEGSELFSGVEQSAIPDFDYMLVEREDFLWILRFEIGYILFGECYHTNSLSDSDGLDVFLVAVKEHPFSDEAPHIGSSDFFFLSCRCRAEYGESSR